VSLRNITDYDKKFHVTGGDLSSFPGINLRDTLPARTDGDGNIYVFVADTSTGHPVGVREHEDILINVKPFNLSGWLMIPVH